MNAAGYIWILLVLGSAVYADSLAMRNTVTPLDSARKDVKLSFFGSDAWSQSYSFFHDFDGPWYEVTDVPEERRLESLIGIRLDSILPVDLSEWDAFVKKHESIPLSFSCSDAETGKRYLFYSGTRTDALDRYIYKVDTVRKWRDSHGPFVCLRPAREWKGLRAEYVFVEKCFMSESLAKDEMQAMCDELVSVCPSLRIENVSQSERRLKGARFRATIHVVSYKGVNSVCASFYNHVPRKELEPWDFTFQKPYTGSVTMEVPCTCMCARQNPRRWNARCRAWIRNASLDDQEKNRNREQRERQEKVENFALLKKELPPPSLKWGDSNGDEEVMSRRYSEIIKKRQDEEIEQLRQEWHRKDAEERAQWEKKDRASREQRQLAFVESNKVAFTKGDAEAALRVSYYYTAYSLKLSKYGKGNEAARVAKESFEWTRKSADAGSPRAQSILGRWLLEGGTGRHMYGGFWSGPVPDIPAEGPYVHPCHLQGLSLPPDVLLCETNGVKTYFRAYRRDPVQGVRYLELAAKGDEWFAKSWISERTARKLPLWMPEWWLRKDGFKIKDRSTVSEETIITRVGLGYGGTVKRKIGRDAEGHVTFVGDEYFEDPQQAHWRKSPWHEANDRCVVQEVLP